MLSSSQKRVVAAGIPKLGGRRPNHKSTLKPTPKKAHSRAARLDEKIEKNESQRCSTQRVEELLVVKEKATENTCLSWRRRIALLSTLDDGRKGPPP